MSEKYWIIIQDVLFRLVGRLVLRFPQPEIWSSIPDWQKGIWHWGIIGIIVTGVSLLGLGMYSGERYLPMEAVFIINSAVGLGRRCIIWVL